MSHTISSLQSQPFFPILTRQQAELRLSQLEKGTEEYTKLQHVLLRTEGIAEVVTHEGSYKVATTLYACKGGFGSSEHIAIGKAIEIPGLEPHSPLLIKGCNKVYFSDILALAGDFYGIAGHPIALNGGTDEEKGERFKAVFNTLKKANNDELRRLLLLLKDEYHSVKYSGLPHYCYSSHLMERSFMAGKIKEDFADLLADNSDHFGIHAKETYRIGHSYATQVAREAGREKNLEKLKEAYAIEAFACHFLTDLFAAGHIRNQRGDLELFLILELGIPKEPSSLIPKLFTARSLAGVLTGAQHEKDGIEGLNVSNQEGEYWRAFGDGCFFTPKNETNKQKVIRATQESILEVFQAYTNPDLRDPSSINRLIPIPTHLNPPPLYKVNSDYKSLVIYQGTKEIEIKTIKDYYAYGVQYALRYLPESYTIDFAKDGFCRFFRIPDIEIPPFLSNFVVPVFERMTSHFWSIVGIGTYHQIRQEASQIQKKTDEIADTLAIIQENTKEILERVKEIHTELQKEIFKDLQQNITLIKQICHRYKDKFGRFNQEDEKKLLEACSNIDYNLTHESLLIKVYQDILTKQNPSFHSQELKIKVTFYFRQMIDFQYQALALCIILQNERSRPDLTLIEKLQLRIINQIEINREFLDEDLIHQSPSYIKLKLEKSRIKRLAFNYFLTQDFHE